MKTIASLIGLISTIAINRKSESIKTSPDNAWVYYNHNRVIVYEPMGERAKAISDLKNALKKQSPQLNRLKRQNAKASLRKWKAAGKL